eukprot:6184476-Pleurochrysis_carterae.AAC.2
MSAAACERTATRLSAALDERYCNRAQSAAPWKSTQRACKPSRPARPACCMYSSGEAGGP